METRRRLWTRGASSANGEPSQTSHRAATVKRLLPHKHRRKGTKRGVSTCPAQIMIVIMADKRQNVPLCRWCGSLLILNPVSMIHVLAPPPHCGRGCVSVTLRWTNFQKMSNQSNNRRSPRRPEVEVHQGSGGFEGIQQSTCLLPW